MKKVLICAAFMVGGNMLNSAFSQSNSLSIIQDPAQEIYYYQYSFEGGTSEEIVLKTKESISQLLHVQEVKVNYKPESGRGEFLITVVEKNRTSESEELFSPKLVKEVILQNGIQPLDFTVTEEIIK